MVARVLLGERPGRPKDPILNDELWNLTQRCLEQNPGRRPDVTDVLRYFQGVLVVQQDRGDVASIAKTDETTVGNDLPTKLPYHVSPSITPFGATSMGLKGKRSLMFAHRVWKRFKLTKSSPGSGPESDKAGSVKSNESRHSLFCTKLGESDTHDYVRSTPSRSRDLLRRIGFCLWICGASYGSDHREQCSNLPEN